MKIGATLTAREVEDIQQRLKTISLRTDDRRIREHCRLIACSINKATRRVERQGKNEPKLF